MDAIKPYLDYAIWAAAGLVALVIVLMAWRAFNQRVRGRRGQRLGISEYQELDQLRRLVLVRRDNVEHLLLIGGPADLVVESGIRSGPAEFSVVASEAGDDNQPIPMRPAPRAPGFGQRRAAPAPAPLPRQEPPPLRDPNS